MFVGEDGLGSDWTLAGISLGGMPRALQRKFKGVYQVVFDGSGTIGQDRAIVYAGATSTLTQWNAFNEVWESLLIKHDLAYLKFAEANTFYGEFLPKVATWGAEKEIQRDALLSEFANLRERYGLATTGCGVVIGTDRADPFAAQSVADKKKEQFQCAILALLRVVPADYAVTILCDVEKDVEERYRGWIESLRRVESDKVARIMAISFADDKFSAPIQFADLLAGVVRKELERRVYQPHTATNPLYNVLVGGAVVTFDPIERGGLLSGRE